MSDPTSFQSQPLLNPDGFLKRLFRFIVLILFSITVLGIAVTNWFFYAIKQVPTDFPVETAIIIAPGSSARTVGSHLKDSGVIASAWLFYLALHILYDPKSLQAGTYTFDEPKNVTEVIAKIASGDVTHYLATITHTEGDSVSKLADKLALSFSEFDQAAFITLAKPHEGRMFPDTYYLPMDITNEEIVILMTNTFKQKTDPLAEQIKASGLTLEEIVILASILEREANSPESMNIVSGILQNRLKIGMALQVDASMEYVLGKGLQDLEAADLELDSPYNTYLYPGLPPTPIGNPGLRSIQAIIDPTPSPYLFYITGNDGKFYYAENFDQHRLNIARHLR